MVEDIQNAVKRASSTTEEIIKFSVTSPKKRPYSEVAIPAEDTRSFVDMFVEAAEGVDINVECLTIMDWFDKQLKVQKSFNSKESVLDRTQEMAEVHNCIGHRNKDVAPMSFKSN